jgi:hypothetical protein
MAERCLCMCVTADEVFLEQPNYIFCAFVYCVLNVTVSQDISK